MEVVYCINIWLFSYESKLIFYFHNYVFYAYNMNILSPKSIEELVIYFLQKKSLSGKELLDLIRTKRPTTKQALYAALRKLRKSEIVILLKKRISLSSVWVIKMSDFFQTAKYFYSKTALTTEGFLNIEEGDRISYTFKNPHTADIFWGHAFDILSEITALSDPVYAYNPHEWFLLARHESERALFDKIIKTGKQIFVVAGGNTYLDKLTAREFDGKVSQYYPSKDTIFEKRNYYVNIFGDYIVEAWVDEKLSKHLDDFYHQTSTWNEASKEQLRLIVQKEGKTKLIISKNKKRAIQFKTRLEKYFYIKK